MGTEIKDQSASYGPHSLDDLGNGWVNLLAVRIGHETTATMAIPDFLAAVETECGVRIVPTDAIVIDRADVPAVTTRPGYSMVVYINGGVYSLDIEARRLALEFFALAEYLDAHPPTPPVDEADVEALAGLILDPAKPYE